VVLIAVIIALDLFVWRPLIAWGEKFKFQLQNSENAPESFILDWLRRSPTLRAFNLKVIAPLQASIDRQFASHTPASPVRLRSPRRTGLMLWLNRLVLCGFASIFGWGTWEALLLLQKLSLSDWQTVMVGAVYTTLRVLGALILSLLCTVPVGVMIGRNPRLAQLLQPVVQIVASVPATALFPVVLVALANVGGGLQVGSVLLMLLGTMWYILFNVIAGAQAIPNELLEAATVYQLDLIQRWKTVILPGIFPYLITGIITAVGGAWNASIVSEYVQFRGQIESTPGLGATISQASASGNFPLLLASTITMSAVVVLTNRLLWRRLYHLAQTKYQLL
jgi:NitT/TauT family transport system permease protein